MKNMKKYLDFFVMAFGVLLYSLFLHITIIFDGSLVPIPSFLSLFLLALFIYFSIRLSWKYYSWRPKDGDVSKTFFIMILFYLALVIQGYLGFAAIGLLLLIIHVVESLTQNSLTQFLILFLYNPIFAYLVMMFILKWLYSKLKKIESISKMLPDDDKKDNLTPKNLKYESKKL